MIAKAIEQQRRGEKRGMRLRRTLLALLSAAMTFGAPCALRAQEQPSQQSDQQQKPSQTPPPSQAPQKQDQSKPGQPPSSPAADEHKYDRYNAEKDIEVGTFYMHKGDADAAIPRFQEAAKLQPDYGKPRLLLAEAYEKKQDYSTALKYYKQYLKVFPNAPDAKKIEKKIEKLEGK